MSSGGFHLPPDLGNQFAANQLYAGYPPQPPGPYHPNSWPQPPHNPGCYPPQQEAACQNQLFGAPFQQTPFLPEYGGPNLGAPYPPGPGMQYGVAPGLLSAGQISMYPVNTTPMPPQQAYHYPSHGATYSGQPNATTGSNIELSIHCTNLKDKDIFSKSDPVCLLFENRGGRWLEIGRTEMILNNLNPRWTKKFYISRNSHEDHQSPQELKFEVYDWDNQSQKTNGQDFLGRTEVNLATILTSPGKQLSSSLKNGGGGKITILAEEINCNAREKIRVQLEAQKLDRMDFLGSSDPYFLLSKKMTNGQWALVYKSEVIKNNCNPRWLIMEKSVAELCNGDYQRELKIEIFDYDSTSKDDVIGEFVTNLQSLKNGVQSQIRYEVSNKQKQRNKRGYRNSGTVSVKQFNVY